MMRAGSQMVGVLHRIAHEPHGRRLLLGQSLAERLGDRTKRLVALGLLDLLADHREERLDACAALLRQLASAQIHRLDSICAFVNLRDAGVADELFHAPFADVAVAAEHLLHIGRDLIALVGAIALDHRGQQPDDQIGLFALFLSLGLVAQIDLQCAPQTQRAHALGEGLGIHQHPADIGVDEDRIGLRLGLGRAGQRPALPPVERIGDRVLIGGLGLAQTLDADPEARGVHHDEHGGKTLVLLADQPALGGVVIEQAGRIAVDAHLLLDRAADDGVALAHRTVLVDEELGHHEQRDAFGAVRRAGGLREHQMDDVRGHVVLAGRDEDLGAGQRVAAIGLRLGLGADHAQIGAALRLGEVHRSRPFARDHLGQIHVLLLLRSLGDQRRDRAIGQPGIHAESLVGRGDELLQREAERMRHALPAEFLGCGDRAPAGFDELCIGLLEPGRRGDRAILVAGAAFLVADAVERREHLGAELAAFAEHGIADIGGRHLEAGQVRIAGEIEHLVEDEAGVAGRSGIAGHGSVLGR